MKICIAQTQSSEGKVEESIQNHMHIIESAIKLNVHLIIFPELSITGFEPSLTKELATNLEDPIFNQFQEKSDIHKITIGVGMPINTVDGIHVSILIFQPNEKRTMYAKQLLHPDELPYFICGKENIILNLKETKIAIGICYEALQPQHFLNAIENDADIYIASVSKPAVGVKKAYNHFSKTAKEFNTPILMSNSIGYCDNFLSVGQSAIWNKKGTVVDQLDDENQGILIYDTELDTVEKIQLI